MSDLTKRQRAEARLSQQTTAMSKEKLIAMSPQATLEMMHDLLVHEIELEMQNEELRESQLALDLVRARYFELYDLAPVGYFTVNEAGLITQANLTAASLLGVDRAALIRKPLSRFIVKADQDIYYLHRKKLLESGEPLACELRMLKSDGTAFWVQLGATAAQDAEGAPELRAVLSDINERKQAEAARLLSDVRLSGLVYSVLDAIIAIDAKHCIILFNPAAERMFGFSAAQVLGLSLDRLVPSRFRSAHGKQILSYADTKSSSRGMGKSGDIFGLHADGHEFPIDASISQLEVNGEKIFTVMLRDVSERDRLYQALQEKNIAVESARAAADKANLAKSEFLSNMSHELRTPLGAILGFAQLMDSGTTPLTTVQKRSIDQILKAGWYLLDLINEILDLALIESGKLSLSLESVSLASVMHECQTMTEAQAQKRGITMTFPRFETPCFVKADHTRVKQILINLLSNAIKYNAVSGTIVVECTKSAAQRIRISISDTGAGLTPDQISHLFQPFNRLGQESTSEQGTGIGLVMAKRLIELMDGDIGVVSQLGKGSTFWFELNLTSAPALTASAVTLPEPVQATARDNAPQRTLLYVEDNPANLMLVEDIIKRRPDITLLTAVDGFAGIKLAVAMLPDVILMDINLPGINGIQVREILAANPATRHIPVVALSANAMPHDIQKGLEAGFFRYLTKPIRVMEFMTTLDVALKHAQSQAMHKVEAQQGASDDSIAKPGTD